MKSLPCIAKDPEQTEWDVVVVGTGMSGSTVGWELAQRGWKVLFLERGLFLQGDGYFDGNYHYPSKNAQERLQKGWWPDQIERHTNWANYKLYAPLGCGSGGSTNLYAAQLERFAACDFHPSANHRDFGCANIVDTWPIAYEEFIPFYRQAESLYRVCGAPDPLNGDLNSCLRTPPPLNARDQEIYDSLCSFGLHPYRSHVAFEYVAGCIECPGYLCLRDCRNSASRICLIPALKIFGAKILPQCEVVDLQANSSKVNSVRCRWAGAELTISGRVVILAAGAWMTPTLLLKSTSNNWPNGLANSSGQVGRNLMFHASDYFVIKPLSSKVNNGLKKTITLNDFYLYEGQKLGTIQTVNRATVPGCDLKDSAVFATILEDLPFTFNRISLNSHNNNGMYFKYHYTDELRARNQFFRAQIMDTLAPHYPVQFLSRRNNINYGHVCGTCRFGNDPTTNVLDKDNRAHELENLYIVDSSFFPSNGGTNPSLTIAANAIRIAQVIHQKLS